MFFKACFEIQYLFIVFRYIFIDIRIIMHIIIIIRGLVPGHDHHKSTAPDNKIYHHITQDKILYIYVQRRDES